MTPAHVASFTRLDVGVLPDVHALSDEARQVFWVLTACKTDPLLEWSSPGEISDILRDCARIDIPRQRVGSILERERKQGAVSRQRKNGKRKHMIMRPGEERLITSPIATMFVDPTQAFSATRKLTDIFGELHGSVRYCDPYIASRTLDFLAHCKHAPTIKLLTVNIQGADSFKADLAAFNREQSGKLQVRVVGQGHVHDRYLLHNAGILLLGASVKDIGKKQSFVVAVGKDIASAVSPRFEQLWSQAGTV
jgi:hypothetical protein